MVEELKTGAFKMARGLGVSEEEVKPVLKKLMTLYGQDWAIIKEDNYRVLIDTYFEEKEEKGKLETKKSRGLEGNDGTSARQAKRIHVHGGKEVKNKAVVTDLSKSHQSTPKRKVENSSSQRRSSDSIPGSRSLALVPTEVRKETSARSDILPGDKKSASFRGTSSSAPRQSPPTEPCSSIVVGENGPSKLLTNGVLRSGSVRRTENLLLTRKPVPARMQGPSVRDVKGQGSSSSARRNPLDLDQNKAAKFVDDITKGTEKIKVSLVIEKEGNANERLPKFNYIPNNIIYQNANINISLARIADEACCSSCSGDCLSSIPCACARETGGEFAYTRDGVLKEKFLSACLTLKENAPFDHYFFCKDCPLEKPRNDYNPGKCRGHLIRKFIKECWTKCGCDMQCGNRVVQRGISCQLQVFLTSEGKGWGLRPLKALPKGAFVCEYIGEVLTNTELYERNLQTSNGRHTYPVTLDADWSSEGILEDEEALCLDATYNGNVARFINHRCSDGNLIDIPVEVETPDHHYYHLAFFTTRDVAAYEELNWDYGIDFDDIDHPIEAFRCCCASAKCRGNRYGIDSD